jgi:hypothetical protein
MRAHVHSSGRYRKAGRPAESRLIAASVPATLFAAASGSLRVTPTILSIAMQPSPCGSFSVTASPAAYPAATVTRLKGAGL